MFSSHVLFPSRNVFIIIPLFEIAYQFALTEYISLENFQITLLIDLPHISWCVSKIELLLKWSKHFEQRIAFEYDKFLCHHIFPKGNDPTHFRGGVSFPLLLGWWVNHLFSGMKGLVPLFRPQGARKGGIYGAEGAV